MGMLLRRKMKSLSENVTTTKTSETEPLPFEETSNNEYWNEQSIISDDTEKEDNTEYSDSDIQLEEEPARRGRPRKTD